MQYIPLQLQHLVIHLALAVNCTSLKFDKSTQGTSLVLLGPEIEAKAFSRQYRQWLKLTSGLRQTVPSTDSHAWAKANTKHCKQYSKCSTLEECLDTDNGCRGRHCV